MLPGTWALAYRQRPERDRLSDEEVNQIASSRKASPEEASIGPNSTAAARLNTSGDELEASRSVHYRWQVAGHRIRRVPIDFCQDQIRSIRVKISESFNVSFRMTGWHASRVSRYSVCTWSAPCNGTRCLTGCR